MARLLVPGPHVHDAVVHDDRPGGTGDVLAGRELAHENDHDLRHERPPGSAVSRALLRSWKSG